MEVVRDSSGSRARGRPFERSPTDGASGALHPCPANDTSDMEALLPSGDFKGAAPGSRRRAGGGCLAASCYGHRARCLHWGLPAVGALLLLLAVLGYALVWAPAGAESLPLNGEAVMRNQVERVIQFRRPSGYHEGDVASPSIAQLPGNASVLVASNDVVARPMTQVHISHDGGASWALISEVEDAYWCSLFFHRGPLYLLCATREYGDMVIRRSADLGATWTSPDDARSGRLTTGEHWHRAPTPIVAHAGRLWHALESFKAGGKWAFDFRACLWSADEDADLLDAASWRRTNQVPYPADLDPLGFGFLEGNAVVGPDGGMLVMIRVHSLTGGDAAILAADAEGRALQFRTFFAFPGGEKKFMVHWDGPTQRYWALSNPLAVRLRTSPFAPPDWRLINRLNLGLLANAPALGRRNVLAVLSSADLSSWRVHKLSVFNETIRHGFQYPDFTISGGDMLVVLRVAYPYEGVIPRQSMAGNLMTFQRIPDFRALLDEEDILVVDEPGVSAAPSPNAVETAEVADERQAAVQELAARRRGEHTLMQHYLNQELKHFGDTDEGAWQQVAALYLGVQACRAC